MNRLKLIKDYQLDAENFIKTLFQNNYCCEIRERKNHQNVLMCIRNLKEKFPKIKYIIIGDGEEKNKLLALTNELKIEKEAIFLNKLDQELKMH